MSALEGIACFYGWRDRGLTTAHPPQVLAPYVIMNSMLLRARWKKYVRKDPPRGDLDDDAFEPVDYQIISIVARNRAVDTDQLARFFPNRGAERIKRRARFLFHHKCLARPRAQEQRNSTVEGSLPIVLTPDRRGIRIHRTRERDPVPMPKWTHDNDHRTWQSIGHLLTTTGLTLDYQFPPTAPRAFRFTPGHELLIARAHERTLKATAPYKLSTKVTWPIAGPRGALVPTELTVATEPDNYFSLIADREDFYFLESDEGGEVIVPNKEKRHSHAFFFTTSLLQKFVVYAHAFRQRIHDKRFSIPHFRVITVTSTPKRVQKIIHACAPFLCEGDHRVRPGLFLFTDRETLAANSNNPYTTPHLSLAGEEVMLLE